MKRALIILLLLACCALSYGQTVDDYTGYTAAQLSAMSDYVTIPNTAYWNAHAYLQIQLLLDRLISISSDTNGVRYTASYMDSLRRAIYMEGYTGIPGHVYFNSGVDTYSGPDIIVQSNTTVSGSKNSIFSQTADSLQNHWKVTGRRNIGRFSIGEYGSADTVANVLVHGFEIDGNADTDIDSTRDESDFNIGIYRSKGVTVRDMYLHDAAGDGIYVDKNSSYILITGNRIQTKWLSNDLTAAPMGRDPIVPGGQGIIISDNFLDGTQGGAVHIEPNPMDSTYDIIITGNVIDLQDTTGGVYTPSSVQAGIVITTVGKVRRIIITNNIIRNSPKYGIMIQNGASDPDTSFTKEIIIANNAVYGCKDNGIEIAAGLNVVIQGNTVTDCNIGVNIRGDQCNIIGNQLYENRGGGLWVYGTIQGPIDWVNVLGNVIYNNGVGTTPGTFDGIKMWYANNVLLDGNQIYDIQDTPTQGWGVYMTNCTEVMLPPTNRIYGNISGTVGQAASTFRGMFYRDDGLYCFNRTPSDTNMVLQVGKTWSTNWTGIGAGRIYPNAVNTTNSIYINGSTNVFEGGTVAALSVLDTAGTTPFSPYPLSVAVNDSNQAYVQLNGVLTPYSRTTAQRNALKLMGAGSIVYNSNTSKLETYIASAWQPLSMGFIGVQANTYNAAAGEMWVNASHDTLWYSADGTNAAFILIGGYAAKH